MTDTVAPAAGDRNYRLLVDAVVDYAIYLLDAKGRLTTWNPGAERIKGYSADAVIGQPFSMFFTEEDRRRGLPTVALETARREGRYESEGWRLRKDGTRFWALAVLDAVRDESGEVIGFAKITRDMTERHAAQQALTESERRFRLLVEGVTDYAIFMLDPEGIVVNWNAGARHIKGYSAAEIVGQHFSRFYSEEDRAARIPQRALAEARETGRFEAEGWRIRKDGTRFWANVIIDAIRDERAEFIGFAKVTRDLTERREAQQALEVARESLAQSQKLEALGQLTGGIAHDFNNLLQVISAGITLAEKLANGDRKLSQLLAEMRNASVRGTHLTKQLLAFSRRGPARLEVVETADAVGRAVALFSHSLPLNVTVTVDQQEGLWPIRVDTAQFEMALLNLAVNARDAMPGGGALRVRARNVSLTGEPHNLTGRFVAIGLRDTGCGIPEEVITRVFEPFFTTKPIGKGTGLGLSQVHGFAHQGGGAVTVTSTVNEGTEVTLFLPTGPESEVRQKPGVPDAGEQTPLWAAPKGLHVLVVDDDAAVGRFTVEMLVGAGHHPVATMDPREALRRLNQGEQYDLVLTDMAMPGGMSGVELGREIRRRWPSVRVVLATGFVGLTGVIEREFPVLHKPFTALELTSMVAMLRRPQSVSTAG